MLNNFKKSSLDDKLGILFFLGSFIFIGIMFWACFKPALWSDESFSLLLIQKSYFNIIGITMADVHPPLYYFILKFVVSLFQIFNLTINSTIIVARFVSVVPFVLLLILAFFRVKVNWGWLCCGIFTICLTSMPQLMYYSVEVRMYSWALFFVTVCFIYAYEVIMKSHIKNWAILMLSGVLAAYTHYFAAVSVIFVFLFLLVYFIFNNKSEIRKWLIAVIVSSSLYIFWLFALINQLVKVTNQYWIEPLTSDKMIEFLWFIVSPSSIFHPHMEVIGILLIISYLVIFIHYFIKYKSKAKSYENFVLCGLFVLILTVLLGFIVSILIKPVFLVRYIVPSLGVFWLTFAFLLSKSWKYKEIFIPVLCVVLIVSLISSATFMDLQIVECNAYHNLDSFFSQDSINNDIIIVDVDNESYLMFEYYTIKYLLKNYQGITLEGVKSSDYVLDALRNNRKVWLFTSTSKENYTCILNNCTKQNLTIKKYASYKTGGNRSYEIYYI